MLTNRIATKKQQWRVVDTFTPNAYARIAIAAFMRISTGNGKVALRVYLIGVNAVIVRQITEL